MARVKHTKRDFYQGQKIRRTTLTKFRLSRYIKWPKWDDTSQVHNMTLENYYHGPLADVEGVVKVRLGRTVDDVEDAVFIILWESADHVKAFQESPALFEPFLRGLGLIVPKDGGPNPSSPFSAVLQYDWGFPIGDEVHDRDGMEGRITLTIMDIRYLNANGPDRAGWEKEMDAGPGSLTSLDAYDENGFPWRYASSEACAYLVGGDDETNSPASAEGEEMSMAVCYLFQRWNATPAMRDNEAAVSHEPERIAEAVSKAPSVDRQSWRRERWDVETAPCCRELCGSLDEYELGPWRPGGSPPSANW